MKLYLLFDTHDWGTSCSYYELIKVFHDEEIANLVAYELNKDLKSSHYIIEEFESIEYSTEIDVENLIVNIKNRFT